MGFGIGTAIGIGASLLGSKSQNKAVGQATQAFKDYAKDSEKEYRTQFDTAQEITDPWRESGVGALDIMTKAMLDGDYSAFETSPAYQFRQDEAQRGVERSAAARGGLLSGNALKAITQYSQNIASDEFNNWYNRLQGMSESGRVTSENQANRGMRFADALDKVNYRKAGGIAEGAEAKGQIASNKYKDIARAGDSFGTFIGGLF